jgi:hypothetical protein
VVKNEILELVNRDQFRNFAIITSGGVRYDITDPNALAVARDQVHYYFPNSDRAIHVPYDQIATIEELPTPKPKR